MSAYSNLTKLRSTYSRAVIAAFAGVPISTVDTSLKNKKVENELLEKAMNNVSETKLDKLKEEITTSNRGRPAVAKKTAKPKAKAKPRTKKKKAPEPVAEVVAA